MASKIKVLSETVINQIAAGEVIENPASVVKELVDNALDAKATKITIELRLGGRDLIRVVDNGEGMGEDDALLSLERHATSKLRNLEDIETLVTMGFRGEALPSICSVSKMKILTNASTDSGNGTLIIAEGGRIFKSSSAPAPKGTLIEVKNLFYNVPVRKKYQRSPSYDYAQVQKMVVNLALANPFVCFQLIHNQKTELNLQKEGDTFKEALRLRIKKCFGSEILNDLVYVDKSSELIKLKGFISRPALSYPNRKEERLFLNRRPISCPLLSKAIEEGYGSSLVQGRFPMFFLEMCVLGSLVDVNVHPQKKEVRLLREHLFFDQTALMISQEIGQMSSPLPSYFPPSEEKRSVKAFSPQQIPVSKVVLHSAEKRVRAPTVEHPSEDSLPPPNFFEGAASFLPKIVHTFSGYFMAEHLDFETSGFSLFDQKALLRTLLAEQKSDQVLIAQKLLLPVTFSFSEEDVSFLDVQRDVFQTCGIEFEAKKGKVDVFSLPQVLTEKTLKNVFEKFLSFKEDVLQEASLTKSKEVLSHTVCSEASFGGRALSGQEAMTLLAKWDACGRPQLCPKGKPLYKAFSSEDVDEFFK